MPIANKDAQCQQHTSEQVLPEEGTSFEQELDVDQEVIISLPQAATSASIPYIEGPKWTGLSMIVCIIDASSGRSNVKTSYKCQLAMLSESRKCKKVVGWSGDFGIDQYVSWDLSPEVCLEVIWKKCEEFCKHQTNEIRARFDLLTSFSRGMFYR